MRVRSGPGSGGPLRGAAPQGLGPPTGELMAGSARTARRKIYLIQPQFPPSYWGQEHFLKLTPYGAVYPPLGLITLSALTPPDYDVTLCDENAGEKIDFETRAEIVGITGYLFQREHVFEV